MKKITIGEYSAGRPARLDLATLLETRLLIMANSGNGKSRALRRFAEEAAPLVQEIIIDLEGEFSTLREKHDFIIFAASGADVQIAPRIGGLLALKLRETRASAVLDLSELKAHQRHEFTERFLDGLIEAPRTLWNPCLVLVDEAQVFAPEKGQGESVASSALVDLAVRGRKRGLCLVASTQRPSLLLKSVSAELKNRMIGGMSEDTDVKRAAFNLGLTPAEARDKLRALSAGHFLSYGPAFGHHDPQELVTGPVATSHPQAGARQQLEPPKASAAVIALLPKLADLPQEAERKAATEADLRKQIDDKSREIAELTRKVNSSQSVPKPDPEAVKKAHAEGFARGLEFGLKGVRQEIGQQLRAAADHLNTALNAFSENLIKEAREKAPPPATSIKLNRPAHPPTAVALPAPTAPMPTGNGSAAQDASAELPKGEAVILTALMQYPDGLARGVLSGLTGYKRSTRNLYLQGLARRGYIRDGEGDLVVATAEGHAAMPNFRPLPTGTELQEYWSRKLPSGEWRVLEQLIEAYPNALERESIEGYQRSTRNLYLQGLARRQLVADAGRGAVKAAEILF